MPLGLARPPSRRAQVAQLAEPPDDLGLDPVERAAIVRRCQSIAWTNGAVDIARYVEDHARIVRTDWDVTKLGNP